MARPAPVVTTLVARAALWLGALLALLGAPAHAAAQPLRVAFIGGSITAGAGATRGYGWAQMTADWLAQRPGGAIARNIGIGGTPSQFGLFRFDRDFGDFVPDLAFIEFAVNDPHDPAFIRPYTDGIIAKFRQRNPRVRIVYVVSTSRGDEAVRRAGGVPPYVTAIHTLTQQEGIDFVDAGGALWSAIEAGRLTPEQALPVALGSVHPTDAGHQIYFAEVQRVVGPLLGQPVRPQSTSLMAAQTGLASATLLPNSRARATGCTTASYTAKFDHLNPALACGDGAVVTLDFTGPTIGLVLGTDRHGAQISCRVDDRQSFPPFDTTTKSTDDYVQLTPDLLPVKLGPGGHRLTCGVSAPSPDRRVIIGSFMASTAR